MIAKRAWAFLFVLSMATTVAAQRDNIASPSPQPASSLLYADNTKPETLSDIGAALNALIGSLPRSNGYVYGKIVIPCGVYTLKTTVVWSSPSLSIEGSGSACTIINSSYNGDAFRIRTSPFTVLQAGSLTGLTINGNSAPDSAGIHMGDIIGLELHDLVIQNFWGANSSGLWFDNVTDFTERTLLEKVHLNYNTKDWRFTNNNPAKIGSSFGYTKALDVRMNISGTGRPMNPPGAQTGISFEGGLLYNSILNVNTNAIGSGATVIAVSGSLYPGGPGAQITDSSGSFVAETDTGGTFANIGPGTTFRFMGDLVSYNFTNKVRGDYQTPLVANAGATPFYQYFGDSTGFGNFYFFKFANPLANRTLSIADPGADDSFVFASAAQTLSGKSFLGSVPAIDKVHGIGSALLAQTGPAGGSLEGLGLNFNWDGSGYILNSDGTANGGQAILGSTASPGIEFYVIPSTGGSRQLVQPSALGKYSVGSIDAHGNAIFPGSLSVSSVHTAANCNSSATPALCGSAAAGHVVIPAGASSAVVKTTAVTPGSEILITFDSSLASALSLTCNTNPQQPYVVARTPGAGFTLSAPERFIGNPGCFSYHIVN